MKTTMFFIHEECGRKLMNYVNIAEMYSNNKLTDGMNGLRSKSKIEQLDKVQILRYPSRLGD